MTEIGEKLTVGMQGSFEPEYKIRNKPDLLDKVVVLFCFVYLFVCLFFFKANQNCCSLEPRRTMYGTCINKNNIKYT